MILGASHSIPAREPIVVLFQKYRTTGPLVPENSRSSQKIFPQKKIILTVKAHTDRTRFGNATRIFSFQKQIKASTDKNFTRYADQIAKIASVVATISKTLKNIKVKCH